MAFVKGWPMGAMTTFASNGGSAPGYLSTATGSSTRGVLVIQEWWGLDDHIKDVAERLAARGFHALAPDLYHGAVTRSPDEALAERADLAPVGAPFRGMLGPPAKACPYVVAQTESQCDSDSPCQGMYVARSLAA
jgi:dienelactone hydrolase